MNSNLDNNFKLVSYKRKSSKQKRTLPTNNQSETYSETDIKKSIRRIREAQEELQSSDIFQSLIASLKEGLTVLHNPSIKEIVCFGLGKIGECMISRYQLALLLCLKDTYKVDIIVFDPAFTQLDYEILKHYNLHTLSKNIEGKYQLKEKSTTIFYLPHCPKQLTNNLLWANWGLNLHYCIIIANSFNTIIESCTRRVLQKTAEYIINITPYLVEYPVINSFRYFEIFNDTAIHIFPWEKLVLVTDLWQLCAEPNYSEEDLEFIVSKIDKVSID